MPDQTPPFNPFDDDDDEPGYCATCCNTGEVDCGGYPCPCGRTGHPCPDCHANEPDPDRLREDRDERVRIAKETPDDE